MPSLPEVHGGGQRADVSLCFGHISEAGSSMSDNPDRIYTACVLIIGNEILSGRTKDSNLGWLAERLNEAGIRLREARVVSDIEEEIVRAINEVRPRYDYVFTTGGIGPTHDDITADCVAKAFGVKLIEHPEALARLAAGYANPEVDLNAARRRMARVPEGGILIDNPVSRAPGFQIGNVFVMAGIPRVMQAMFESFRHRLKGGKPMISRQISAELPEGRMAEGLTGLQSRYNDLEIGSYPFARMGKMGAAIVLRGTDQTRIDSAAEELKVLMTGLGGNPVEEATS
jgi:molybdenum cofactor synthesis domain-containing protein